MNALSIRGRRPPLERRVQVCLGLSGTDTAAVMFDGSSDGAIAHRRLLELHFARRGYGIHHTGTGITYLRKRVGWQRVVQELELFSRSTYICLN